MKTHGHAALISRTVSLFAKDRF